MPKVSVIIPTYNRADFLAEAIQSVLEQTARDFELLIIDDGSTDNTKNVVDSFNDRRIKYIYQKNSGVCIARNTGIKQAIGNYLILLDSDDILLPSAIEDESRVLDEHPESGLIFGLVESMNKNGDVFSPAKAIKCREPGTWPGTKEILNLFVHRNYICPSQSMVRKSAIMDVGMFDPAFSSGSEDFELWVRIAKKYSTSHLAKPVTKYRVHDQSLSGEQQLTVQARCNRRIYAGFFNDPELGRQFARFRPKAYFHFHLRFAAFAYGRGQMNTARRYLTKALKIRSNRTMWRSYLTWMVLYVKTYIPVSIIQKVRKVKNRIAKRT